MTDSAPRAQNSGFLPWPVLLILILCILPEVLLQLAAYCLKETVSLRGLAYMLGAFQPGIMSTHGPLFPGQTLTMFITYGLLHTDLWHLGVNMVGLIWLGRLVLIRRSSETFLTFYLLATIAAAETFALIGPVDEAMVGASGALFGLLGVYLVDNGLLFGANRPPHRSPQIARVIILTLGLVLADISSSTMLGSPVAWQAHAGGFLTGALLAVIAPPQAKRTA